MDLPFADLVWLAAGVGLGLVIAMLALSVVVALDQRRRRHRWRQAEEKSEDIAPIEEAIAAGTTMALPASPVAATSPPGPVAIAAVAVTASEPQRVPRPKPTPASILAAAIGPTYEGTAVNVEELFARAFGEATTVPSEAAPEQVTRS